MPRDRRDNKQTVDMSEIAMCTLRALARSKQAISEHAQELCKHALHFNAEFLTLYFAKYMGASAKVREELLAHSLFGLTEEIIQRLRAHVPTHDACRKQYLFWLNTEWVCEFRWKPNHNMAEAKQLVGMSIDDKLPGEIEMPGPGYDFPRTQH